VDFEDSGPVFEQLKPGDQVTATVWRRDIVALGKGGLRQHTNEAPRDALQMNAALGTLAGLFAALAFVFGAVRLARPGPTSLTWYPFGGWMFATIPIAGIGVGATVMSTGIPWWYVPPAVPVVACLVAWASGLLLPLERRSTRDRSPRGVTQN
jgi:hypothetical protein